MRRILARSVDIAVTYVKGKGTLKWTRLVHEFLWKDGELTGDVAAMVMLRDMDLKLHGKEIGAPFGPWHTSTRDHLKNPRSVRHLARMVFEDDLVLEDDLDWTVEPHDPGLIY